MKTLAFAALLGCAAGQCNYKVETWKTVEDCSGDPAVTLDVPIGEDLLKCTKLPAN